MPQPFLTDIRAIRERARRHIERGAVTEGYRGDREAVLRLLQEALLTEIVCVLRYKRHYYTAKGVHSSPAMTMFKENAAAEQEHADEISERIAQLGGEPDWSPKGLATKSYTEYHDGTSLREMLEEDLVAERIVIESYSELVRFLGDKDPTTRRMIEHILAEEEDHAEDLASFLGTVAQSGSDVGAAP